MRSRPNPRFFVLVTTKQALPRWSRSSKILGIQCLINRFKNSKLLNKHSQATTHPCKICVTRSMHFRTCLSLRDLATQDALFPDSKFILTVRESVAWFESLKRFHLQGVLANIGITSTDEISEGAFKDREVYLHKNYMYNIFKRHAAGLDGVKVTSDWSKVYDQSHRINVMESRNNQIVNHFIDRPDQLLVIDLSRETDNSKIVRFLNLPKDLAAPLPHLNKSG